MAMAIFSVRPPLTEIWISLSFFRLRSEVTRPAMAVTRIIPWAVIMSISSTIALPEAGTAEHRKDGDGPYGAIKRGWAAAVHNGKNP